jgi:vacuolar-type H+-ATPase subunit H
MNVNMKEILFSGMTINNMEGKLTVNGGKAHMSNLSMNTLGGKVVMNGAYSTANSEIHPGLDAAFAMTDISFAQAFKELVMIQQMAPIFEKLNGNFSGKISIDTQLDETMSPMLQTLTASGNLSTRDLNLTGVEVIDKIADATHHTELKQLSAKDLNINFTIKNGRIATQPFELKMGNMGLTLSGTTGLDQSIDYTGKLRLPSSTSGINTIDFKIGGQFKSPSISIDTKSIAKQAANTATEKAMEAAAEKLGIDLKNAEKQKEELVQAAQDAANKLVEEAEKQKANLVNKAGNNAIKKLAAEKAGDALITEAKKKGEQLVAEAERKGNSLIQKAQQ